MSQAKPSRRFAVADLPDPVKINATFVYNFFTPDERLNDLGDRRIPGPIGDGETQRLINRNSLNQQIPRYIKLSYSAGTILQFGNMGDEKNTSDGGREGTTWDGASAIDEEIITTGPFYSYHESDPDVKHRIREKFEALSDVVGLSIADSEQTEQISTLTGVEKSLLQPLVAPLPGELFVNFKSDAASKDFYDFGAKNNINMLVNKRIAGKALTGYGDISSLSAMYSANNATAISKAYIASSNRGVTQSDIYPNLPAFSSEEIRDSKETPRLLGARHVGYIIERTQYSPNGLPISWQSYPIKGTENTEYIDDNIVYGTKYSYTVRNTYRIDAIVDTSGTDSTASGMKIVTYIASRPSVATTVETVEHEPPTTPDGLLFRFNYRKGRGLILSWQAPVGRSQDIKFFQIFKRKSIHDPFMCIAELDFDDSDIKTLRAETIDSGLVRQFRGMVTSFEDTGFNRESDPWIYAVCAVDAHGLTSGYSAQTIVKFNITKNEIELKNISRPGAPKQYPNFFIDPDMDENLAVDSFSQDAIFDSGKHSIKVYFTPDARICDDNVGSIYKNFVTSAQQGKYKMHIINLDLQKSTTAELKIDEN